MPKVHYISSKLKEIAEPGAWVLVAALLISLKSRTVIWLMQLSQPIELAEWLIYTAATLLLALAWTAALRIRLASRASPNDYEIYHPNIGVTVYRDRETSKSFDFNTWYCPRCLTIDHKLSHRQARHDLYFTWDCMECKSTAVCSPH